MGMITLDVFGLAAFSHNFGCCENLTHTDIIAKAAKNMGPQLARRHASPLHPDNYFCSLPTTNNRSLHARNTLVRDLVDKTKNFTRPDEFLLERWVQRQPDGGWTEWYDAVGSSNQASVNDASPAGNRMAFLRFAAGDRICPGKSFAIQEAILVLAGLLRQFRFETADPKYELKPTRHFASQHPHDGIPMEIFLRTT